MITLHCRPAGATATEIRIDRGVRATLPAATCGRQVFALLDQQLATLFPEIAAPGWQTFLLTGGEQLKSMAQAELVLAAMAENGLGRDGLLLVVGGGTLGDLGGFCASLYLRGVELWQAPTTVLAMVDSAVGGKTAVNLAAGKNLVGTIHPPSLVVVDLEFATTLAPAEYRSGLAETLKIGIGADAGLFELLERHAAAIQQRDLALLGAVVERSLAAKIAIVEDDLREGGARRRLNLGHTLGHALEAASGWQLPHGLAVARGLYFALEVALELRAIEPAAAERCRALLAAYGHQPTPLPPAAGLLPFLARDKKQAGGALQFVLPTGIGSCEVRALEPGRLQSLLRRA